MKWFILISILFNIKYAAFSQKSSIDDSSSIFNNTVDTYFQLYSLDSRLPRLTPKPFIHHKSFHKYHTSNLAFSNNQKIDLRLLKPSKVNYNYISLYNYSMNNYSNYKYEIPLNFDINSALIHNKPYSTYTNIDSFNPYGAIRFVDAICLGLFNSLLKL